MKAYAIAFLGSLGLLMMGCNIEVDDCGDDDWDDDDDQQPCETHVHSDTSSTTTTSSGSSGSSGGSGGGGSDGSGATGGGPSNAGGSTGSGGSNGDGSGGSNGNGSGASGGTASSGNDSGGGSAESDSASTTGAAGACNDCNALPDGESCLWGVQKMDSCCGVDVLVDVAAQECADYGLELADFVLQDSCSGGHRQVDFQCCKTGMSGCTTEEVALEACVGEGIVTDLAEQVCADMGQDLSSFEPSQACGADTYQGVEVTCCVMDPE